MPNIVSNETYSVKVREIDEQHKKLIGMINELHEKMKEGKGKDILQKIILGLVDYTKYHFTYEEKLFVNLGYPETLLHKKNHEKLLQQVNDYFKKIESNQTISTVEVMNFLRDWLLNHIQSMDQKYTPFFNAKGIV